MTPVADSLRGSPSHWLRGRLIADRVIAALLAIASAPVVAILWALIRRDGGPGVIRVARVGRNGRVFAMWKLRSMRAETGSGLADGASITRGELDPRITPIGRHIRSYHLDELPQLWNVAAGEMGILGPRPEAPEYVDRESEIWTEILSVPPGMAGPTQLVTGAWERALMTSGSDDTYRDVILPVKLNVDRWYLRESSPAVDVIVVWALLKKLLPGIPSECGVLKRHVREAVPEITATNARTITD